MLERLDPAFVTLFAEPSDRLADARLIEGLPPGGTFERRTINGRPNRYHRAYNGATGRDTVRYVAPASPELASRVECHASLKHDVQGRPVSYPRCAGRGFRHLTRFHR
jgi:hypothetical protein